ncbi:hypothetical protein QE152_g31417 [Popillia japonica]|uniref:Uncharacterized protein n=1 Tax=Popillia japonica TaxID=7064 RepID=A0AAW1J237_POPJA
MNDYWMSDDDIKNDMLELSDFSKLPQPAPEPSEFMKKLRGKPSIFEDNFEEEIEEQPVVEYLPVRGHPLLKNGIRKPGGRPISHEQHTSAHTDIREVTGFGYGNDLIEHAFKNISSEDDSEPNRMKNLAFDSPTRKNGKKSSEDSDSSMSSSSDKTYCSKSPPSLDIHNKKEFPALK